MVNKITNQNNCLPPLSFRHHQNICVSFRQEHQELQNVNRNVLDTRAAQCKSLQTAEDKGHVLYITYAHYYFIELHT